MRDIGQKEIKTEVSEEEAAFLQNLGLRALLTKKMTSAPKAEGPNGGKESSGHGCDPSP